VGNTQSLWVGVDTADDLKNKTLASSWGFALPGLKKRGEIWKWAQHSSTLATDKEHTQRYDIFGEIKEFNHVLYSRTSENIGNLNIYIDPALASEGFVDRSLLVLISGLVRNILMAFTLVFVFYLTVTKKVIAVSSALKDLDPSNPGNNHIPELNVKKKNELDDLREGINRMLEIMSSDIQERQQREQDLYTSQTELTYQANHDPLTGLVNRRGFEVLLNQAMQSKQPEFVFCYLELDQFKIINDTCGHIAGDELLRQIGHLLNNHIRGNDALARLGGYEFGILMQYCNISNAGLIAQKLIDKIGQYRFFWEGKSFAITASIGIASLTQKIKNTTDLLRNADIACYTAKDAGRNCFRIYQEGISDTSQLHGDMQWVNKINQALENNDFCLYAQKIVPNITTTETGLHYEVLLRMLDIAEVSANSNRQITVL
jgi:diguanylate cyclase (GGDEF)-like protein